MERIPKLIIGGKFTDERGTLSFVNDFTFDEVKRLYVIEHPNIEVIRAWQGHKLENKWFYVISGSFKVVAVKIHDWENPSASVQVSEFILDESNSQILHIPEGYANGFQALLPNSKMIGYSNFSTEESKADDFRFDKSLWYKW